METGVATAAEANGPANASNRGPTTLVSVLTGGCMCGAVRFEIDRPLLSAGYCHCTRCQRRTGTAASCSGRTEPGSLRVTDGSRVPRRLRTGRRRVCEVLLLRLRLGALEPASGRPRGDRHPARGDRRRSRGPPVVPAVRRVRGSVGARPGRRAAAVPGAKDRAASSGSCRDARAGIRFTTAALRLDRRTRE